MENGYALNPIHYPNCALAPRYQSPTDSWQGHIPFAFSLIQILRPATLVELGVWWGDSFFAFCQGAAAIRDYAPSRFIAIDHFQGDEHAGKPSGAMARSAMEGARHYPFSEIWVNTFDEALTQFSEPCIDILHIDGLHTYEATKHNFESWRPLLSPRGVVLFHDVQRDAMFGSTFFWEEIRAHYPHFKFEHSHGLGVLLVGPERNPTLSAIANATSEEFDAWSTFFAILGMRVVKSNPHGDS